MSGFVHPGKSLNLKVKIARPGKSWVKGFNPENPGILPRKLA